MADDRDLRSEHLVAVRMVVMPMCVDDVTNGLVGERLDVVDETPSGLRRDVRIHEKHIVRVHDDHEIGRAHV